MSYFFLKDFKLKKNRKKQNCSIKYGCKFNLFTVIVSSTNQGYIKDVYNE